jgi:Outer membrane protein beta-barrel domain
MLLNTFIRNGLLSIIASFIFSFLFAQERQPASKVQFGFVAGASISNMNFNKGVPAPATPIGRTWKAGVSLGFLINVPLVEKLFLQPGYYYIQRNGGDKSTGIGYQVDYLSLPVLLKYSVTPVISVLAGPEGSLLISARQNNNGVKTTITDDFEERSIGATGGIDIALKNNFLISARILEGLNHIGIGQGSANLKEFKYESASLSIGIAF